MDWENYSREDLKDLYKYLKDRSGGSKSLCSCLKNALYKPEVVKVWPWDPYAEDSRWVLLEPIQEMPLLMTEQEPISSIAAWRLGRGK